MWSLPTELREAAALDVIQEDILLFEMQGLLCPETQDRVNRYTLASTRSSPAADLSVMYAGGVLEAIRLQRPGVALDAPSSVYTHGLLAEVKGRAQSWGKPLKQNQDDFCWKSAAVARISGALSLSC
jgi:hypothetical protein